jgi:hypothetical protein
MIRQFFIALAAAFAAISPALAQSTSGVSGSDVNAGEDLFEYRFSFSPENDGKDEGFTHRLHYQHGFSDSWRGRALLTFGKHGADPLTAQTASIEILHQFKESEDTGGWDSAIRIDGNIPLQDGIPGRARVAWHNQLAASRQLELRGVILVGHEFGDHAKDGVTLETREEMTYKLPSDIRIGAQMFNNYGSSAHFGSFDEQKHQLGPVLKGKLGDHVKYEFSTLFGLSAAASDADIRFFLSYKL